MIYFLPAGSNAKLVGPFTTISKNIWQDFWEDNLGSNSRLLETFLLSSVMKESGWGMVVIAYQCPNLAFLSLSLSVVLYPFFCLLSFVEVKVSISSREDADIKIVVNAKCCSYISLKKTFNNQEVFFVTSYNKCHQSMYNFFCNDQWDGSVCLWENSNFFQFLMTLIYVEETV